MRRFVLVLFGLAVNANMASAQSILERVLDQIGGATNLAPVNGTYANIAESVLTTGTQTVSVETTLSSANVSTRIFRIDDYWVTVGDLGTTIPAEITGFYDDVYVASDGTVTIINATDMITGDGYTVRDVTGIVLGVIVDDDGSSAATLTSGDIVFFDGTNSYLASAAAGSAAGWNKVLQEQQVSVTLSATIDGSILNTITGLTAAAAEVVTGAGSATVLAIPTVDLGNMSTTVLGAVDTGEITLGVNSAVDEAGTTSSRAISGAVTQIGGSAGAGALVLNLAHNASSVDGSIQNTLLAVNGSVGNLATTTLGAVNTGTITSGVNAAVNGIVGIAGPSGL